MITRALITLALGLMLGTAAIAQTSTTIQTLYYTGTVTVNTASGASSTYIGQELDSTATITLGKQATLQLSVNGKLHRYNRPSVIKVAKLYATADSIGNTAVVNSLRTIAASRAISPDSALAYQQDRNQDMLMASLDDSGIPVISETTAETGIPYTGINRSFERDNKLVILEPRSTDVNRGPIRFRWLRTEQPSVYVVSVSDAHGTEVFHSETSDTSVVWEGANLFPESSCNWTLTRKEDTNAVATATFRRLNDLKSMRLEGGESQIRIELGSENPALPLLLAAHFANSGCHGEAARYYTIAAMKSPEHYSRFMALAIEEYRTQANLNAEEVEMLFALGCD